MRISTMPPNRSFPFRKAVLLPVDGIIGAALFEIREQVVEAGKVTYSRYAMVEGDPEPDGRRFRLTKSGGGEAHYVFHAHEGPAGDLCQCTGFLQYGECKHAQGVRALIRDGHLPVPQNSAARV